MPTVEQKVIFRRPPAGVRKVVLATNIAETSITIDDIVYVIDGGKAKEKTYDAVNNLACLLPAWVSKAAARQRRGPWPINDRSQSFCTFLTGAHCV